MLKKEIQNKFVKVQAVYQFLMLDDREMTHNFLSNLDDEESLDNFDQVINMIPELQEKLSKYLHKKWKWSNLNFMIKAILISGAYDLTVDNHKNSKIIIDGYIGVSRIFGEEDSLNFIHKNLQNICNTF